MTATPRKAVVLLSGGLDSATVLAMAAGDGFACHALSFDYGQRHRFELQAAARVAKALGAVDHRVVKIDLTAAGGFGHSALTDKIDVPKDQIEGRRAKSEERKAKSEEEQIPGVRERQSEIRPYGSRRLENPKSARAGVADSEIPVTYVPARNTIFLSIALGYAEVIGAFDIFIGVNAVDYSGYPDCRGAFIEAFERLANLATAAGVEGRGKFVIHAPLIRMTKARIIRTGLGLGVPYELTHSCYDPTPDGLACGHCDSCQLRLAGFAQAGTKDPVKYRKEQP